MITEKTYKNTAQILYMLDKKLASVLHVESKCSDKEHVYKEHIENEEKPVHGIMDINNGCDLAILYIAKDGSVTVSAGNLSVFICDGKEVTRHKGQPIFIGEGALKSEDEVKTITVPANPDNKFYISSDGLFDQIGGEKGRRFGHRKFQELILEHHGKPQKEISKIIWENFEEYRGQELRRDDFEMISFKP